MIVRGPIRRPFDDLTLRVVPARPHPRHRLLPNRASRTGLIDQGEDVGNVAHYRYSMPPYVPDTPARQSHRHRSESVVDSPSDCVRDGRRRPIARRVDDESEDAGRLADRAGTEEHADAARVCRARTIEKHGEDSDNHADEEDGGDVRESDAVRSEHDWDDDEDNNVVRAAGKIRIRNGADADLPSADVGVLEPHTHTSPGDVRQRSVTPGHPGLALEYLSDSSAPDDREDRSSDSEGSDYDRRDDSVEYETGRDPPQKVSAELLYAHWLADGEAQDVFSVPRSRSASMDDCSSHSAIVSPRRGTGTTAARNQDRDPEQSFSWFSPLPHADDSSPPLEFPISSTPAAAPSSAHSPVRKTPFTQVLTPPRSQRTTPFTPVIVARSPCRVARPVHPATLSTPITQIATPPRSVRGTPFNVPAVTLVPLSVSMDVHSAPQLRHGSQLAAPSRSNHTPHSVLLSRLRSCTASHHPTSPNGAGQYPLILMSPQSGVAPGPPSYHSDSGSDSGDAPADANEETDYDEYFSELDEVCLADIP